MSAITQTPTLSTERVFYCGMAALVTLTVLVGFGPTFFVRAADLGPLPRMLVAHGIVFTAWFALLIAQAALVAADRRDVHRKLGILGAGLAVAMVVLGTMVAVESLRLGRAPVPGLDPRAFFAIPMRDIATFAILVACAVGFRRDAATHKRLMLMATLTILVAAIARLPLPFMAAGGPPAFYGLVDLLIVGVLVYDYRANGRVHGANKWAAALIILSQPLTLAISGTAPWLALADWAKG